MKPSTTHPERTERLTPEPLRAALADLGAVTRGGAVSCPFHEDKSASGSVFRDRDGVWRFKCHAGSCGFAGDVFDVIAKGRGVPVADLLKADRPPAPAPWYAAGDQRPAAPRWYATLEELTADVPHAVATFKYTNPATGAVELAVIRAEPPGDKKQFRQARPERGGWVQRKPDGPMPVYNRTRLRAAPVAVVVEGEKAVHALTPHLPPSAAATTAPGGAGKGRAAEADWSPLAGKAVYLWPDNDAGGLDHMRAVAELLKALDPAPEVHWIDPAGLGLAEKGDAADLVLAAGADASGAVERALESATTLAPSGPLRAWLGKVASGEIAPVRWPDWPHFTRLAQALVPGTLTVICGEAGAGKSFFALQAVGGMIRAGVRASMLALEERPEWHLNRYLAQLDGNGSLTDLGWLAEHPGDALAAFDRHRPALDALARRLETAEGERATYAEVIAWADRRLAAGDRVLVVDPITAAAPDERPWAEDARLVLGLKKRAEATGASIVLTTHPRKGGGKPGSSPLDDMAGGAAFNRFAPTTAWLKRLEAPEDGTVGTQLGRCHARWNRVLHLTKTRNGRGGGMKLAYWFRPGELTFQERGVIESDQDKGDDE